MSSRIEQIIDEIEEYIDRDCKYQPLSTTKIVVNKEHLEELLRELRLKTPERLVRTQIGPIKLGDIKSGSYRVLSQDEVRALSKEVGL